MHGCSIYNSILITIRSDHIDRYRVALWWDWQVLCLNFTVASFGKVLENSIETQIHGGGRIDKTCAGWGRDRLRGCRFSFGLMQISSFWVGLHPESIIEILFMCVGWLYISYYWNREIQTGVVWGGPIPPIPAWIMEDNHYYSMKGTTCTSAIYRVKTSRADLNFIFFYFIFIFFAFELGSFRKNEPKAQARAVSFENASSSVHLQKQVYTNGSS